MFERTAVKRFTRLRTITTARARLFLFFFPRFVHIVLYVFIALRLQVIILYPTRRFAEKSYFIFAANGREDDLRRG